VNPMDGIHHPVPPRAAHPPRKGRWAERGGGRADRPVFARTIDAPGVSRDGCRSALECAERHGRGEMKSLVRNARSDLARAWRRAFNPVCPRVAFNMTPRHGTSP
jgi:hypothetical protein